ncbi:MAG TPA: hypothetical protein VE398_05575 [Acidobacteriota bacterium]|nr:hypothetical protein [Acidobacteriota bacterium]
MAPAKLDQLASRGILALGFVIGAACFVHYFRLGLTLAHYDAKAHLVVARRIVDSLVPGYAQMGVDWLPFIHILYLPFVIVDAQYRSGLLPSLISVASFATSGWLVLRITWRVTGSTAAGVFASLFLFANPNLEYLQSCPLTEPVYMMLQLLSLDTLMKWRQENDRRIPWMSAIWAALGALCRYEGWYFIVGVILLLLWDLWKGHKSRSELLRAGGVFVVTFALPAAAHFGFIYARLGDSFLRRVALGNPAPYETYRRPLLSLLYHVGELCQVSAVIPLLAAFAGVIFFLVRLDRLELKVPLLLLWLPSLINISALYWGMIYRLRYSVLLLPAVAIFAALPMSASGWARGAMILASGVAMSLPWLSWLFPHEWKYHDVYAGPGTLILPAAALGLLLIAVAGNRARMPLLALCILGMQLPVLSGENRPMLAETLEHSSIEPERQEVLRYLRLSYDGTRILIDMGKLAPLVYDSGLPIKKFVYDEGGAAHWETALRTPESEVGWLVAQREDEIWQKLQVEPHWADAYDLAVRTDLISVYRLKSNVRGTPLPARRSE